MAAGRLDRGPVGREMLLAARPAEDLPRQDRRERDLAAGLDLVGDMDLDRAAAEALEQDPFPAAHYPPMLDLPGAWREAEPAREAAAVGGWGRFPEWWRALSAVPAEQEPQAALAWSRPKRKSREF